MNQNLDFKDVIQDELKLFDIFLSNALKSKNRRIADIINHSFKVAGKRIRPSLVLLVAKAVGEITPATYHGAVTVELLHTATLIHDDVIDESPVRRGQPSASALFDNKRAVLAGDYLLSSSVLESVKTENLKIVEIISELGKNLSEGELDQYALANDIVIDEDEYLEVIDKKTASLLYACAKIGAITGGADDEVAEQFGVMGRYLGLAFQIKDDIFDYYSDDVGKPTGNDIREGKITLPLIHALRVCSEEKRKSMLDIISSKEYTSDNIEQLLDFAKESQGIEYAHQKMDDYLDKAERIITESEIKEDYKGVLNLMFMYLRDRKY